MEQQYDVFISYARKDYFDANDNVIPGNAVSLIMSKLTSEGITYWFDKEGIYSGDNFIEKIVANIEASSVFIYISSFNANDSKWTCKEIASADEFGKHIIPVRIDKSPYNKKVTFRIADLSFIPYYANPEKALDDLADSIKAYLAQLKAEELKRKEEEKKLHEAKRKEEEERKRQKELEEQQRKAEQQRIIKDIKIELRTLNNEETKLEADRNTLLAKTELISNPEEKESLQSSITNSSPIRKNQQEELKKLQDQLDICEAKVINLTKAKEHLANQLTQLEHLQTCTSDTTLGEPKQAKDETAYDDLFLSAMTTLAEYAGLSASKMVSIGNDYCYGTNRKTQDYSKAAKWYRLSAEQGDPDGQCNLGYMFEMGFGVNQDYSEAVKWYRKASEQGLSGGQYHLGYMYHNGLGVEKDLDEAEKWFKKAAAQGNIFAKKQLEK